MTKNYLWLLLAVGIIIGAIIFYRTPSSTAQFEVELVIKDHIFTPNVIKVPKNQRVKLTIINEDDTIEEFDSPDLNREKIIPAGGKAQVILSPLLPGSYKFTGEFNSETAYGVIEIDE